MTITVVARAYRNPAVSYSTVEPFDKSRRYRVAHGSQLVESLRSQDPILRRDVLLVNCEHAQRTETSHDKHFCAVVV